MQTVSSTLTAVEGTGECTWVHQRIPLALDGVAPEPADLRVLPEADVGPQSSIALECGYARGHAVPEWVS